MLKNLLHDFHGSQVGSSSINDNILLKSKILGSTTNGVGCVLVEGESRESENSFFLRKETIF